MLFIEKHKEFQKIEAEFYNLIISCFRKKIASLKNVSEDDIMILDHERIINDGTSIEVTAEVDYLTDYETITITLTEDDFKSCNDYKYLISISVS